MTVTKVGGASMIAHAQWPLCPPFPRVAVFYVTPSYFSLTVSWSVTYFLYGPSLE